MGAFCCCSSGDDFEEYPTTCNPIYSHCLYLRFFFLQLFTGYGTAFQRIEGHTISSSTYGDSSISSGLSIQAPDNFSNDACHSVPRPLPFDADQRYSRLHRDGLVYRREKSMTHLQEESQQLRRNMSSSAMELLGSGKKQSVVDSPEEFEFSHSQSSEKLCGAKITQRLLYIQPSSEEEDVCPTCLEEYTPENPKITTRCSHHFHLGCIYEWMERSESCPICGKDMDFSESP